MAAPNFDTLIPSLFGPELIGYTVTSGLLGLTLAQSILYFRSFPKDSRASKILVASLCVMDTFHIYLLSHMYWQTLVSGRLATIAQIFKMPWQLLTSLAESYIVVFIVQCFFCLRVWNVSGKKWHITAAIAIAALIQLGSGLAFVGLSVVHKGVPEMSTNSPPNLAARTELVSAMVCDIIISASLAWYFHRFRNGMARTHTILQDLIIISVNMGLILCLVTGLCLILFEVYSGNSRYLAPQFILSKLYVNSLIGTLNSRAHFRDLNKTVEFSFETQPRTPGPKSVMHVTDSVPMFKVGEVASRFSAAGEPF